MRLLTTLVLVWLAVISLVSQVFAAYNIIYYGDWTNWDFPPASVDYSQVTHINYAFATFGADFVPKLESWSGPVLREVVSRAHARGVKVLLSVGGYANSRYFSPMVASTARTTTFINGLMTLVRQYSLDGVTIDWEYPGVSLNPGTLYDAARDVPNFYTFLRALRTALGTSRVLGLDVGVNPFTVNGKAITNGRTFSDVVDYANVMAYDAFGPWSTQTGPHESVAQALQAATRWINTGFSSRKIVIGYAAYGRSARVATTMTGSTIVARTVQPTPQGDVFDTQPYTGVYRYNRLLGDRVLLTPSTANTTAGWKRYWDQASSSPYLFNSRTKVFITYEDPSSVQAKASSVRARGYAGMCLWEASMDSAGALARTARSYMG